MTDRLQKAIDAGGVMALFPLLADWPADELNALLADCEAYHAEERAAIEEKFKAALFTQEVFFSDRNTKRVTDARKDAQLQALAVTSEICSVALYYLGDSGEQL